MKHNQSRRKRRDGSYIQVNAGLGGKLERYRGRGAVDAPRHVVRATRDANASRTRVAFVAFLQSVIFSGKTASQTRRQGSIQWKSNLFHPYFYSSPLSLEIGGKRLASGNFRGRIVTESLHRVARPQAHNVRSRLHLQLAMQASKSLCTVAHARRVLSPRTEHRINTRTACLSTFAPCRPVPPKAHRHIIRPHTLSTATSSKHLSRPFSSSHHLLNDSHPPPPTTSFPDPTRPDLFYHLVFLERTSITNSPFSSDVDAGDIPVFAVSLLERPPPFAGSSTVLGWLPAEGGAEGEEGGEGEVEGGVGLNDFTENREFLVC